MALNNHNNGTRIKSRIQIKIMLMKVKTKTHLKTLLKINQNLQTVINQKMIKTKRLKMKLIMIKTTLIKRTTKHKIIKINNKLIKINNSNNNVKVVAKKTYSEWSRKLIPYYRNSILRVQLAGKC